MDSFYCPINTKRLLQIRNLFIIIFFLLSNLQLIHTAGIECKSNPTLNNEKCFNNLHIFNHKKIRAGHFATTKNGDLIAEFSVDDEENSRIFYGLKNNGENYFTSENGLFEYTLPVTVLDDNVYYFRRYDSINYFVNIGEEGNEYLFSINPYKSFVELQDLKSEHNTRYTWTIKDFFKINEEDIIPNEISLFELKNESAFIMAYYLKSNGDPLGFKKFRLKSFDEDAYEEINYIIDDRQRIRILDSFSLDEEMVLGFVHFFIVSKMNYYASLYIYNCSYLITKPLCSDFEDIGKRVEMYYKTIWLKDSYIAAIFFTELNNGKSLKLDIYKITQITYREDVEKYDINRINFNTDVSMSDFFKLNEKKLCFISTEGTKNDSTRKLHILLFHFYDNYTKMKMRSYSFDINDYIFIKELSGYFYNNYLVFATTSILKKEEMDSDDLINYFSVFMIFGYPNGTNNIKDISYLFSDYENFNLNIY